MQSFPHSHRWRVCYGGGEVHEPPHEVSIREIRPDALALELVQVRGNREWVLRRVDLRGWRPIWYRCPSFDGSRRTRAIVFGRALPQDDGIVYELSAVLGGRFYEDIPGGEGSPLVSEPGARTALQMQALVTWR